jgi:hypothetical protein
VAVTIEKCGIGKGIADAPIALLYAPEDAPAGSLVALVDFLNAHPPIRAVAGYHGPDDHHVLRISGFENEQKFLHLLQQEFAPWCTAHTPDCAIKIADELQTSPIDASNHFPFAKPLDRFLKQRAELFSGAAYTAGNVALLFSALRQKPPQSRSARVDWFKTYSAAAYNTASTLLIALSLQAKNGRDVYDIMQQLYPRLSQREAQVQEGFQQRIDQSMAFVQNHPWEIAALINMTGAASHSISALTRKRPTELLATLGTIASMAIAAFVPEKNSRQLIDLSAVFDRSDADSSAQTLSALAASRAPKNLGPLRAMLQENPLAYAAGLQAISNVGYGASALMRKSPKDIGLAAMSGAYLTGNVVQTFASKGRGAGLDDVVSAAAEVLLADPLNAKRSPQELQQIARRFAKALVLEKEIVHPKERLARGIETRLAMHIGQDESSKNPLAMFTPREREIMQHSPFIAPQPEMQKSQQPSHAERVITARAEADNAGSSIHAASK